MSDGVGLPSIGDGMNKLPPPISDEGNVPSNARGEQTLDEKETRANKRKQKKEDQALIKRALKRFKRCEQAETENRKAALEDLKFKAGDQWPAQDKAARAAKKRPCLTINTMPTLTHQISNDIRQNRPGINVSPLGSQSSRESADIFASMIRSIERDSAADIAYDTGVCSAVDIGFGYWRVLTEYESSTSVDDQVIILRRVRNPFTVLLDYARQEPDGSDSRFGFVSELLDRDDFEEDYPDANPVSWNEKMVGTDMQPWATKDQIRVAEYFEITHDKKRLVRLSNGFEGYYDDLGDDVKALIEEKKIEILRERDASVQRVDWYRLTCLEVLKRQRWLGKWIPIVEVIGDEIDLEGKVLRVGVIRNAKDPARMKNYWTTTKTELYGLQPKAPWVGPEGSFEGYEDEWDRAHNDNITRLEYVPQTTETGQPLPAPSRSPPPAVAAGLVDAEKQAEQDLMGTTGVRFNAQVSERMHDESGKAIRELRRSGDIGAFHFTDNFSRSLRHTGRILIDLVPKIYNHRRLAAALAEDGTDSKVMIDPDMPRSTGRIQPQDPKAEPIKVFNPKLGEYTVTVTVGPSYATRRIEAQENLESLLGKVPEPMRGVIAALMAKYADWPGANDLYKALAKMLPPGILMPDNANLPPEVAGLISQLNQRVTQLMGERAKMIKDLTDQTQDRAVKMEEINKNYEAKLMKIFADLKKASQSNDIKILGDLIHAEETFMSNTLTGGGTTGDGRKASVTPIDRGGGGPRAPAA